MRAENDKYNPQNLRTRGLSWGNPFKRKPQPHKQIISSLFQQLNITKPLGLESDHEEEMTQLENFKDLKPVKRRVDMMMLCRDGLLRSTLDCL